MSVRCWIPELSPEPRGCRKSHPPPTKCTTSIVSPATRMVSYHTDRETISRFLSTATASSSKPSLRIRSPTENVDAHEKGSPLSVTASTSAALPTALEPLGIPALYAAANRRSWRRGISWLGAALKAPRQPQGPLGRIRWGSVTMRSRAGGRFGPLSWGNAGSLTVRTPLAPVQPVRRGSPVHMDEPIVR